MRFSGVFVLASLVISSFASTAADVKADIVGISAKLTILDNATYAIPLSGGTLPQFLAFYSSLLTVIPAWNKGAADIGNVSPNPLSLVDARAILECVDAVDTIPRILDSIVARKKIFGIPDGVVTQKNIFSTRHIPTIPLIKMELVNLKAATQNFQIALIQVVPTSLVPEATAIKTITDAAFDAAIAFYS
ncbi:hypothetical protein DXG03_005595 [Asterophora parasitica]|uniref:Uncharacterized protein n=1 Tax=Asterophora parasitica TaxID=117018 RepID=A0A9P7FMY9_9AGAR|nr:hypothetical protein DXG03_005595 [Asterophora parasitica]